jgi:steroid 5-alpha reductase family enzyme
MTDVFLASAGAIAALLFAVWLLSIPLKNVSIIDIAWGFGFVVVGWTSFLAAGVETPEWPHWILPVLVTVWGLRLTGYLAWRNIGKPEDYRYVAMREKRGPSFVWSSLLRVFALQGVILWVVSLPIQAAAAMPVTANAAGEPCLILTSLGVAFWATGVFFEAVGDWQLARFKANPDNNGRVMDRGLWRLTRHPNYFGDFCVWWGHWLVCLGVSEMASTWWTILSPAIMSFFLIKVSGIALLEKAMKKRSPEYEDYIRRTSSFLPLPPKRLKSDTESGSGNS